jgi:hypothetical protein
MDLRETQIKILYVTYKWSPKQIGQHLDLPTTYIQLVIEEHPEWDQSLDLVPATIEDLKSNSVNKQVELAPLYVIAEVSLLSKITEALGQLDVSTPEGVQSIERLTKAYKQLNLESVFESKDLKPGIAIQVVNQI